MGPPPEERVKRCPPTDTTVVISVWKFSVGGVVWGRVVDRLSEACRGTALALRRAARLQRTENQEPGVGEDSGAERSVRHTSRPS